MVYITRLSGVVAALAALVVAAPVDIRGECIPGINCKIGDGRGESTDEVELQMSRPLSTRSWICSRSTPPRHTARPTSIPRIRA